MKQSSTATGRGKKTSSGSAGNQQHKSGSRQSNSNGKNSSHSSNDSSSARNSRNSDSSISARDSRSSAGSARNSNSREKSSTSHEEHFQGESHLEKFFLDQLKDIYYAEQKITQSLPKMQEAATTQDLKEAFEDHLHQTQRHVKRLEKAFESLGKTPEGEKCEAIEGIAREVDTIINETEEGTLTRDAALIIAAQKVEHYEIATYGGLLQLAITMELHEVADLLDRTLVEEEDTDARLTEIAENEINLRAEHEGSQTWQQGEEEGEENNEDEEGGQTVGEETASPEEE